MKSLPSKTIPEYVIIFWTRMLIGNLLIFSMTKSTMIPPSTIGIGKKFITANHSHKVEVEFQISRSNDFVADRSNAHRACGFRKLS